MILLKFTESGYFLTKMENEKIYHQEIIEENPFPGENVVEPIVVTQKGSTNTPYNQPVIQSQPVPRKRIAQELISEKLNTTTRKILAEFQFTPSGALQIGNYQEGENGDIRISPVGIVARDVYGNTTFALDGETGNAVFKGSITSGSLITGSVLVGGDNIELNGDDTQILLRDEVGNVVVFIGYQENAF